MTIKIEDISLPRDWYKALDYSNAYEGYKVALTKVISEIKINKKIAPNVNDIFNAFNLCSYSSTKVVIFGQDPYFQYGVANGLAFAVDENQKIPPSLKNINQEVFNDIGYVKNRGNLKTWSDQGVLLLNSSLTVEIGKPGSHRNIGWNVFVDDIIRLLDKKGDIVFMLWGNDSKKLKKKIKNDSNLILESSHPSPLSSYRGFFGCKHFSKCNNFFKSKGHAQINW